MTNVRELCCEVAFILIEGAPACAAKVGADDICKIAQTARTTTRPCLCRRVNFHGTKKNQNFICMNYYVVYLVIFKNKLCYYAIEILYNWH